MKTTDLIQIIIYVLALIALTPILGLFMAQVFTDKVPVKKFLLSAQLEHLEKLIYRCVGIDRDFEMTWKEYAQALLVFNFLGLVLLFLLQLIQSSLPLNPQNLEDVPWHLSLNTAISFMTNTNWQSYAGESTLSYFTQMVGLTSQNFLSAATGLCVFLALTRGFVRTSRNTLGNFWVDLTKSVIYVLLPLSIVFSIVLLGEGVIQNFSSAQEITTLEGQKQLIPQGPAASQIAIKQLGTNGGGFFNANSAHPYENPTPLSNFLQMLALILLPSALTFTYGRLVGSQRQGWVLFSVMLVVWLLTLGGSLVSEYSPHPIFGKAALMEGKETRIGVTNSLIWSTATTAASNGSVNSMHSSLSPLAGGLALFNILLGEVIFGGLGSGLYGLLLFVLLTVFIAGLMVGRSPEYLGKKIEAFEIQMALTGILSPCAVILIGTAITVINPVVLSSLSTHGPHGFSEILYAFASAAGNNGSAFSGLNANTVYFNLWLGGAMLIGRFAVILPVLALAGRLVQKKKTPVSAGTFSTDTLIFAFLLIAVIIIVGALTSIPALSLGPIIEHFLLQHGKVF